MATPTQNQIKIQYIVKRYRHKHEGDAKAIEALEKILWWSYPIVYTDAYEMGGSLGKAQNAIDARKRKKNRVNKILKEMMSDYDELFFATFTFTDETLGSTAERTRHRYVQAWLNENCRDYYANQDFGAKNGREHYHAVVALKRDRRSIAPWKYGFSSFKPVRKHDDDTVYRTSGYLLKLANHAGKVGTGKSFRKKGLKEVDNLPF